MGALVELAAALGKGAPVYPFTAEFRMGGARPGIEEAVRAEVVAAEGGVKGTISLGPGKPPYMEAVLKEGEGDPDKKERLASWLPASYREIQDRLIPLPFYRNCFVCGRQRRAPGLERRFYVLDAGEPDKRSRIVVSPVGLDPRDEESFYLFRRNQSLHPLAFLALLDEAMGWGGFLTAATGAVTVRIDFHFYRAVSASERLIVFGRGERARGKAGYRLMFWASGGAAALREDGTFETVIAAAGQWYGLPELTAQMKTELIPAELTRRAFALAGESAR
jgi:hypothetical protein